jgi:hypothetical protein
MQRWIMGLSVPFIGWRREGRWYHREEMVNSEWSYLMFSFRGEERKGQRRFKRGKENARPLLISA